MCFSATASFVSAALTGGIGVVAVSRAGVGPLLPLAAMPLIFSAQQLIEGLLWLALVPSVQSQLSSPLTYMFLLLAEVLWPAFVPLAVFLAEPEAERRKFMLPALVVGLAIAGYLLIGLIGQPHEAVVIDGHIVYRTERPFPLLLAAAYLGVTTLPMLVSSQRTILVFGVVVLIGWLTAYNFYWQAFESTWCFFAAVASGVILFHFLRLPTPPRESKAKGPYVRAKTTGGG